MRQVQRANRGRHSQASRERPPTPPGVLQVCRVQQGDRRQVLRAGRRQHRLRGRLHRECHFWLTPKTIIAATFVLQASRDKCGRCSQPILQTILKALDDSFHPSCFTCSQCPLCLDGIQFYLSQDKKPLCQVCYARSGFNWTVIMLES